MPNSEVSNLLKQGHEAFFANPPDYESACRFFSKVIEAAPNWIEGHCWMGSTLGQMNQYPQAIQSFQRAILCDPTDPRPQISMGVLLTKIGHLEEAIKALEKGVALKPHYAEADARLFLAEAYEKANKIEKAREQWMIIIQMDSAYPSYDAPINEARSKLKKQGFKL